MADPITITFDTVKLDSRLMRLAQTLTDVTPMLEEIGMIGERTIKRNFKDGGRPDKWPTSTRARKQGGQTLMDTGNLRSSVSHQVMGKEVAVGSNVLYGPIHHFGGTIRPKSGKYLRFPNPSGEGWIFAKSVTIPARPWLVFHKQTAGAFNSVIRRHVEK